MLLTLCTLIQCHGGFLIFIHPGNMPRERGLSPYRTYFQKRVNARLFSKLSDEPSSLGTNNCTWTKNTLVGCHRQPWLNSYLPRTKASIGMFPIPLVQTTPAFIRFPLDDHKISSPHVVVSHTPQVYLCQEVHTTIKGCKSCFISDAFNQIFAIQSDLSRCDAFGATRGRFHQPRRDSKCKTIM